MKKAGVLSYPLSAQQRLWSDWADAQADLCLCWAHSHLVGFVMSRLMTWQPLLLDWVWLTEQVNEILKQITRKKTDRKGIIIAACNCFLTKEMALKFAFNNIVCNTVTTWETPQGAKKLLCFKDTQKQVTAAGKGHLCLRRIFSLITKIWPESFDFALSLTTNTCSLHENQHYHAWSSMVLCKTRYDVYITVGIGCYCFHT